MYFVWVIAFDFIDDGADTLKGIVRIGIGVLGVWLGMLIAQRGYIGA